MKTLKFLLAFIIVHIGMEIGAVEYFVATNGNNAADGLTPQTAFATILRGAQVMLGGDTVTLLPGLHRDPLWTVQTVPDGTVANPTIIRGQPGANPTNIVYCPTNNYDNAFEFRGCSNVLIYGFTIDGTNNTSSTLKITGSGAGVPSHNITVSNMVIRYCHGGQGILATPANSGTEDMGLRITHCTIYGNGWDANPAGNPLHQIYIQTSSNTVEYCHIEGTTNLLGGTLGIHHFVDDGWNCTYRNNFITNCLTGIGILSRGTNNYVYNNVFVNNFSWAVQCLSTTNCYVLNNSAYNCAGGYDAESGCRNIFFENNIAVGCFATYGAIAMRGVQGGSLQNNLSYSNYYTTAGTTCRAMDLQTDTGTSGLATNGNLYVTSADGVSTYSNAVSYNVKFSNPNGGDLHLLAGSDAISAGRTQTLFTTDYAGLPHTPPWSVGAYEFVAAVIMYLPWGH